MANNSPSSKYNRRGAGQWPFVILRRAIACGGRSVLAVMTAPARRAAYQAVRAISAGRSDLPTALHASREHLQDERDRSLAAEIVTGTLRWQRSLDHLIEHFSRRRIDRLDAEVVAILRLSLYQLLHLDRVPASAVVDDAVDLTRGARKTSASGFVNGVLRSTLRQRHKLPLPSRPTDLNDRASALAYLGVTHSHPDWLVSRWLDRYGFEATERWVQFNNATPPLTLRVNRLRATREEAMAALAADGVETEPTRFAPDGLVGDERQSAATPCRRTGRSSRTKRRSWCLPSSPRPGERVLDLCASPGGKTIAMAADMDDTGAIVASDVRPRRLTLLHDTVREPAREVCRVVRVPTRRSAAVRRAVRRVLVDAPCSGLGTVRRDPGHPLASPRGRPPCAGRATSCDAPARAAEVVRPGGRLVYATCSSEPEENDGSLPRSSRARRDFRLVDLARDRDRGWLCADSSIRAGFFRTTPPAHRSRGVLRRGARSDMNT